MKYQIKNNFNKAENYDKSAVIQKESSVLLANICSKFIKNPKTIIDIGCGTGITTLELQKYYKQAEYTLCDISENMINCAKNKVIAKNYIVCDAEYYEFNTNYDFCVSNLALQWIDDFEAFLCKMLSKCKYFAFSILTENSFYEYKKLFKNKGIDILFHNYYSVDKLENLLKIDGKILKTEFKSYDLVFENSISAAQHFKNIGANSKRSYDTRIASILLSHREKINLNYNIYFAILESKK